MTETEFTAVEFNRAATATLARIEAAAEAAELEYETPADGIVEIEFDDGGKIIVNRHGPLQEIWVAARAGGFHFKRAGDDWIDTRDATPLFVKLAALIAAQGGGAVEF